MAVEPESVRGFYEPALVEQPRMRHRVAIEFDSSARYTPQIASLQEILGPQVEIVQADCPDFVIYGPFPITLPQRLRRWWGRYRSPNARKIFWTGENARPDFSKYDWCVTFDYDDIVQHPRHVRRPVCPQDTKLTTPQTVSPVELLHRKFCNFLYSQPGRVRDRFFDLLSRYKPIDAPGASKNNCAALGHVQDPRSSRMSSNWIEQRLDFVRQYKFTIAFENSSYPGYVTEKMWHTLMAGSVPIYWGNPLASRDFNPKSFINIHEFQCLEEAVEWVRKVDAHDDLYLSYFSEAAVARPDILDRNWQKYRQGVRNIFLAAASSHEEN